MPFDKLLRIVDGRTDSSRPAHVSIAKKDAINRSLREIRTNLLKRSLRLMVK